MPTVDTAWNKIDYQYISRTIHSLAVKQMQSKRKNISARKSIIGALSNSIGNKSSDAGEALAPSGDSILSVIRNASAHTTGDINQSFLAVYRPLKNLYNSSTVQNRVVENVKKGQLESLKRSIKANALDLQMEKNNGLPAFRPAGRSRFGACCIGQDSILLFGGRFRDTLEASCLWSLKPWWKIAEYKSAKSCTVEMRRQLQLVGNQIRAEIHFTVQRAKDTQLTGAITQVVPRMKILTEKKEIPKSSFC